MKTVLAYIFTALLVLPFHILTYVKTVLHVVHQDHAHHDDHNEDGDHSHDNSIDHESDEVSLSLKENSDLSHQHAPNQPVHSHHMEIWGLFSNPGVSQRVSLMNLPAFKFLDPPVFEVNIAISELFSGSLLRPPIA
jgi:hypothetical protein